MKIICTITGMLVFFAAASLTAQQVGTITGLATDVSGQPVVGVQVYISALDQGAIAQTNGRYLLQNIPTGVHTVTAQRIGYRTVSGEVTVTEGQVTSFDFQLFNSAADDARDCRHGLNRPGIGGALADLGRQGQHG